MFGAAFQSFIRVFNFLIFNNKFDLKNFFWKYVPTPTHTHKPTPSPDSHTHTHITHTHTHTAMHTPMLMPTHTQTFAHVRAYTHIRDGKSLINEILIIWKFYYSLNSTFNSFDKFHSVQKYFVKRLVSQKKNFWTWSRWL